MNEVEKIIKEEIKDMKRIGRNIKNQKGKRGIGTGNFNPLRGMTQKQINAMHGETKTMDMKVILPISEFKFLDESMKKVYLESWRAFYGNEHIAENMGVGVSTLYAMYKRYEVTGKATKNGKRTYKKKEKINTEDKEKIMKVVNKEKDTQEIEPKIEQQIITLDTNIVLRGKLNGKELSEKLKAMAMFVEDDNEYTYVIELKK